MSNNKTKIRIRNFKCLEDIEIELKPLTLLFGPNGSGKSAFIKALRYFSKNIFNPRANTIFKIDDELDLNNYHDIVTNNNLEKPIIFNYSKSNADEKYDLEFNFTNSDINRCYNELTFNDYINNIRCRFKLNQKSHQEWIVLKSYEDSVIKYESKDEEDVSGIEGALFDHILFNFINNNNKYSRGLFGNNLEGIIESLNQDMIDCEFAENDINFLISRANLLRTNFNEKASNALWEYLNFNHLGALRQNPGKIFLLENNSFSENDYYGLLNKENYYWDRVNKLLKKLDLNFIIKVIKENYCGYLHVTTNNGTEFNLSEANSGLIQLLPIVSILEISELSTTLIEQPELHIHPKLQAKLVDYFVKKISEKKRLVIETHSEHIVRKLQVLVAQNVISKDDIGIFYFNNEEEKTIIQKMELDPKGLFVNNWPDGFFDTSTDLTLDLYEALRIRNQKN
jgi:predicted ATPase